MKSSILKKLSQIYLKLGEPFVHEKINLIQQISTANQFSNTQFSTYHDILLFLIVYPTNKKIEGIAKKELKRLSNILKSNTRLKDKLYDTGLPFTSMYTRFSHDLVTWMHQQKGCKIELDSFDSENLPLNTLLKFTLPNIEKEVTNQEYDNDGIFQALEITPNQKVKFIINEFSALDGTPFLKDHLWNEIKIFFKFEFTNLDFSKSYNNLKIKSSFYQNEIIKKFDHQTLINAKLPALETLSKEKITQISNVINRAMILSMRETDTTTYMNKSTLRYYELERGISIAIFGMVAERQLALQSYIGFVAFKNGYPVSYGGSWIFGPWAKFGINVFETFRGGESGYLFCQILRVFKQVFHLTMIEIESYQFGNGNSDGIKSGAFWFYYHFGFRPMDLKLLQLAEKENKKIATSKEYRTSENTLIALAESNMSLNFNSKKVMSLEEFTKDVAKWIGKHFEGDRTKAEDFTSEYFIKTLQIKNTHQLRNLLSFKEWALVGYMLFRSDNEKLQLIKKLIFSKEDKPYAYNKLLLKLLS